MVNEIFLIILLLAGLFYWFNGLRIKEIALAEVKARCQVLNVQMLDDYVAVKALRLARDKSGRWCWRRTFEFEFSSTGDDRYRGSIVMLGQWVESIHLEPHRIATCLTQPREYL